MKAAEEIGWARMLRFGAMTLLMLPYKAALFPPLRVLFLRLLGARVGRRVVLHDVRFFNLYRRGLSGLRIGDDCFLGDECLLDLAEGIELQDQVTLAERVLILTHTNVGYRDHPLQRHFPASAGDEGSRGRSRCTRVDERGGRASHRASRRDAGR